MLLEMISVNILTPGAAGLPCRLPIGSRPPFSPRLTRGVVQSVKMLTEVEMCNLGGLLALSGLLSD